MLEEHPDEVTSFYGEMLLFPSVGVVSIPEGDMSICDLRDPAVGDGGAERISREVTDRVASSVEGFFDKWEPPFLEKPVNQCLKTGRILRRSGMGKIKQAFLIQLL